MFARWPSIESLAHIKRSQDFRLERVGIPREVVTYRGKVKLHGTNSCIRVEPDGQIFYQSHTNDVTPGNDNAGFAQWASQHVKYWQSIGVTGVKGCTTYIYGEWTGQGINKGCACHQVKDKFFAVFALGTVTAGATDFYMMVEPKKIAETLDREGKPSNVYVLPWGTEEITLDYNNDEDLRAKAETINRMVLEVEACDPWIKATFGYDGVGEGIVFYPITALVRIGGFDTLKATTDTMFKAKGEKHRGQREAKPATVDVAKVASGEAFAAMFVTEPRCEQALAEGCKGELLMTNMGSFLAWMGKDVEKESKAELEASGLTWKDVAKYVQGAARTWFMNKVKGL